MSLELRSAAFEEGHMIPNAYTGDGHNLSPPLQWLDPPSGAKSFAVICEDPDAPRGVFTHWVLFNLPAESCELSEGVPTLAILPNGTRQGTNDFNQAGYSGPAPPRGKPHRYFFKLYALDTWLDLPPGVAKDKLIKAMSGHTLAEGRLMGRYVR